MARDRSSKGSERTESVKRVFLAGAATAICAIYVSWSVATAVPPAGNYSLPPAGAPTVSGTVSLRATPFHENLSLPATAVIHVELLDISRKDAGVARLGEDSIWIAAGKLPVSFRIAYDPSRVDPAHVYVIRARITENDRLLYQSAAPYYVLTRGAPANVDVIVSPSGPQRP